MLEYKKIVKQIIINHINECILAELYQLQDEDRENLQGKNDIEKGFYLLYQTFIDSLGTYDTNQMTLSKFVKFNRSCLFFEYETDKQESFLKTIGKEYTFDIEIQYYTTIYPVFKIMYDEFIKE